MFKRYSLFGILMIMPCFVAAIPNALHCCKPPTTTENALKSIEKKDYWAMKTLQPRLKEKRDKIRRTRRGRTIKTIDLLQQKAEKRAKDAALAVNRSPICNKSAATILEGLGVLGVGFAESALLIAYGQSFTPATIVTASTATLMMLVGGLKTLYDGLTNGPAKRNEIEAQAVLACILQLKLEDDPLNALENGSSV